MKIQGCNCSIVIKTTRHEFNVPYSEETIREAVSLLQEEAPIEGNGVCKVIQKKSGVTGCVVTPLTIDTAPLLLYLAMGSAGLPVYVSETRNLYSYKLNLQPMEDTDSFDLIQDRGIERKVYEQCRIKSFELRYEREKTIKLKLDIYGMVCAYAYLYTEPLNRENPQYTERFNSNKASYKINGREYNNIYGITILSKKETGTKTEIWIRRSLEKNSELPGSIEEIIITAKLLRDKYEYRHFGLFRITLKKLVLISDETNINNSDAVIGPLRYYVSGEVTTEVFSNNEGIIA